MKAYKLEVLVIDFENMGCEEIKSTIENARYPNYCISPSVEAIQEADIGEWDDDHPLNKNDTCDDEYTRLFGGPMSAIKELVNLWDDNPSIDEDEYCDKLYKIEQKMRKILNDNDD